MKLNELGKCNLEGFKVTKADLENLDDSNSGYKASYSNGIWRIWRVENGKLLRPSSGGWRTASEALSALDNAEPTV